MSSPGSLPDNKWMCANKLWPSGILYSMWANSTTTINSRIHPNFPRLLTIIFFSNALEHHENIQPMWNRTLPHLGLQCVTVAKNDESTPGTWARPAGYKPTGVLQNNQLHLHSNTTISKVLVNLEVLFPKRGLTKKKVSERTTETHLLKASRTRHV